MKLKKVRTCNKCLCFEWSTLRGRGHCQINIPIVKIATFRYQPTEPCPKPLTNKEYYDVKKEYR